MEIQTDALEIVGPKKEMEEESQVDVQEEAWDITCQGKARYYFAAQGMKGIVIIIVIRLYNCTCS